VTARNPRPRPKNSAEPEARARSVWGVLFVLGVWGWWRFLFWSPTPDVAELRRFEGHQGLINAWPSPRRRLGLSRRGSTVASGTWRRRAGATLQAPVAPVKDVAVLPDGKTPCPPTCRRSAGGLATGNEIATSRPQGALTCRSSPDGSTPCSAAGTTATSTSGVEQKRCSPPAGLPRPHRLVNSVSLSRDGQTPLRRRHDVRLWDVASASNGTV